jgi:hypothetical protein
VKWDADTMKTVNELKCPCCRIKPTDVDLVRQCVPFWWGEYDVPGDTEIVLPNGVPNWVALIPIRNKDFYCKLGWMLAGVTGSWPDRASKRIHHKTTLTKHISAKRPPKSRPTTHYYHCCFQCVLLNKLATARKHFDH